jgi:hypothetical protein
MGTGMSLKRMDGVQQHRQDPRVIFFTSGVNSTKKVKLTAPVKKMSRRGLRRYDSPGFIRDSPAVF